MLIGLLEPGGHQSAVGCAPIFPVDRAATHVVGRRLVERRELTRVTAFLPIEQLRDRDPMLRLFPFDPFLLSAPYSPSTLGLGRAHHERARRDDHHLRAPRRVDFAEDYAGFQSGASTMSPNVCPAS